jgi:hypothetical protein
MAGDFSINILCVAVMIAVGLQRQRADQQKSNG